MIINSTRKGAVLRGLEGVGVVKVGGWGECRMEEMLVIYPRMLNTWQPSYTANSLRRPVRPRPMAKPHLLGLMALPRFLLSPCMVTVCPEMAPLCPLLVMVPPTVAEAWDWTRFSPWAMKSNLQVLVPPTMPW